MLTATTRSTLCCKVCSWSSTEEGRAGEESASGVEASAGRLHEVYLALGKEVALSCPG